jgi:hypothetical protein
MRRLIPSATFDATRALVPSILDDGVETRIQARRFLFFFLFFFEPSLTQWAV